MKLSDRHLVEDEDADKLVLGPDFEEANGLLNDEVRIVLEALVKSKRDEGREVPPLLERSLAYATRLSVYQNRPTLEAAREVVQRAGLTGFQAGTIGNLTPGSVEEAFALVPGLRLTFPDETEEERETSHDALQSILEGLEKYKKHT